MTELLKPDHLRRTGRVLDQSGEWRQRLMLVQRWTADAETGRPVANWMLDEDRDDER
jgi:hypothetical protein